ncbi:hypothetical protein PV04_10878 [Phialophora macrospora]|uniref:AAA+ ATPase domain-containing protein n=1 Tax=Phialophora macrospora TaxID=1851006 RepID=A0A0D2DJZ9_9EURO|nr:hypothetical protein PV04_10878 [Phialophora macrospora]
MFRSGASDDRPVFPTIDTHWDTLSVFDGHFGHSAVPEEAFTFDKARLEVLFKKVEESERKKAHDFAAEKAKQFLQELDVGLRLENAVDILNAHTISQDQTANSTFSKELLTALSKRTLTEPSLSCLRQSARATTSLEGLLGNQNLEKHSTAHQLPPPSKTDALMPRNSSKYERRYGSGVGFEKPTYMPSNSRIPVKIPPRTELEHSRSSLRRAPLFHESNGGGQSDTDVETLATSRQKASDLSSIDELQRRVEQLERENARLRGQFIPDDPGPVEKGARYQVFHVIKDRMYLDEPTWGPNPEDEIIRSVHPVDNVIYFYERHPEVALAVIKKYNLHQERPPKRSPPQPPVSYHQEIDLVTSEMKRAVEDMIELIPQRSLLFPHFRAEESIHAPYVLIHACYLIKHEIMETMDPETGKLIQMLFDVVLLDYGDVYQLVMDHRERGVISSVSLPFIFQPGEVIISTESQHLQGSIIHSWPVDISHGSQFQHRRERVPIVSRTRPVRPDEDVSDTSDYPGETRRLPQSERKRQKMTLHEWSLDIWWWTYDGSLKRANRTIIVDFQTINSEDEVEITSLKWYPLVYASDAMIKTLEKRGRMFSRFEQRVFVSYSEEDNLGFSNIDERYMIDNATYHRLHSKVDDKFNHDRPGGNDLTPEGMQKDQAIFLYPPTVIGYNMRLKKWVDLYVDRISDVKWNDLAFEHLVIDSDSKDLIQALVGTKIASDKGTDIIVGKGNGLLVLLHGPPGTGKTLTAEGVAEFARKPLYRVTCGDIGTTPEGVEQYLQSVLHLGKIWDCVVLLDEADVFLEERGEAELQRNALVSVFLRCLEYYDGILILTSNRVGTFDEAFKSRIQLSLHYNPLNEPQRRKIWRNFVNRLRDIDSANIEADEILDHLEELSHHQINGRQIRNAITTARQLAQYKGQKFNYMHLKHVIEVANKFETYLKDMREGLTDDEVKRGQGYR